MKLSELFLPELSCLCKSSITNKKKVLELISKLISSKNHKIKYQDILDNLQKREKIGSTALGHGIAIPHARVKGIHRPYCAVILLKEAINFSYPEEKMVDLIFGLVVPENYNEEHLQLLSSITENLCNTEYRQQLRHAENGDDLYKQLIEPYVSATAN